MTICQNNSQVLNNVCEETGGEVTPGCKGNPPTQNKMQFLLSLQVKVSYIMEDMADDQQTTICILWCIIHKDGIFLWKQFKCKFVSLEVFSPPTCICALRCFIKLQKDTERNQQLTGGRWRCIMCKCKSISCYKSLNVHWSGSLTYSRKNGMPGWLGFGVMELWLQAWPHLAKIFRSNEVTWTWMLASYW